MLSVSVMSMADAIVRDVSATCKAEEPNPGTASPPVISRRLKDINCNIFAQLNSFKSDTSFSPKILNLPSINQSINQQTVSMPSTTTIVLTVLAGLVAATAAYIYLFGIPPELKRDLEKKALRTMGENKASYILKGAFSLPSSTTAISLSISQSLPTHGPLSSEKSEEWFTNSVFAVTDQISKVPASDQEDVKELKRGLGNVLGGATKNPLGDAAGDAADDVTKPFTGR